MFDLWHRRLRLKMEWRGIIHRAPVRRPPIRWCPIKLLLCASSVFSVVVCARNNHRDTENTEVAQRNLKPGHRFRISQLRMLKSAISHEVSLMKKLFALALTLALFCFSEWPALAQDQRAQQATTEEQEKQKAEREKNAYRLLDQVIDEAQSLRLPENRVRVQTNAADMLWDQNQGRARSLFSMAADGVAEMARTQPTANNNRRNQVVQDGANFNV